MNVRFLSWAAWIALAPLAQATGSPSRSTSDKPSSVLLVVIDDIGVDKVGAYAEHPRPGRTPTIDGLARDGVLFRNAWSAPRCSPARAMILSGLHGFRTGIGDNSQANKPASGLSISNVILPEALGSSVPSWAIGKWHLGGGNTPLNPVQQGFDVFSGTLYNFSANLRGGDGYFIWNQTIAARTRDGPKLLDQRVNDTYATTASIDETLFAVRRLPSPWFVYLALHSAHRPLHVPPDHLHTYALEGDPLDFPEEHTWAMVEAVDTELGRLFRELPPDTTVIFMGDNGTSGRATSAPFDPAHSKGTLYEGGVNVPLIISGPGVAAPGRECTALVGATDIYATVLDLIDPLDSNEHPLAPEDSVSLAPYLINADQAPVREFVFAEFFRPNGIGVTRTLHDKAIRDDRYKLIYRSPVALDAEDAGVPFAPDEIHAPPPRAFVGSAELYDLLLDPLERENLLLSFLTPPQAAAYARLLAKMKGLAGP